MPKPIRFTAVAFPTLLVVLIVATLYIATVLTGTLLYRRTIYRLLCMMGVLEFRTRESVWG